MYACHIYIYMFIYVYTRKLVAISCVCISSETERRSLIRYCCSMRTGDRPHWFVEKMIPSTNPLKFKSNHTLTYVNYI